MRVDTKLIHAGVVGDENTGAVSVPIYQVTTYKQQGVGQPALYEYSRSGNPTRAAVEKLIADLENGTRGFAFASGMAGISTVFALFDKGDHVIVGDDVYGGTYRFLSKVVERQGIEITYVDTSDLQRVSSALRPNTKGVFVETPTNPLLKVTDVAKVAAICKKHSLLLIVDNTFLTPYWQNPLDLGADIVVHSATKYLGGHSDVVAGLAVTNNLELGERLYLLQKSIGGVLGPYDSWLLIRGIKTLGLRMRQHEASAHKIVDFLSSHPKVESVRYPGLKTSPGYDIMKLQSRGFGGIVSFTVKSPEEADKILTNTKYFTLAESLGAVESLISLPAKMTHASIPEDRRRELGITDTLIRLSIGVEDTDDLIEDLAQSMA